MNEALAEALWRTLNPTMALQLAAALGVALLWSRWRLAGRLLVTASILAVLATNVFSVDGRLLRALEDRFSAPNPMPADVAGIVVLGGSVEMSVSEARGLTVLNHNGDRLVHFAALARQYPKARLVFAGGGQLPGAMGESQWSQTALRDLGVDISRLAIEGRSTSTYENARLSYELVEPLPDEVWLLVTSAWHMPRAVGCFRKVGWNAVPYPVGFLTGTGPITLNVGPFSGFTQMNIALREWFTLFVYRFLGRTDAVLPGP